MHPVLYHKMATFAMNICRTHYTVILSVEFFPILQNPFHALYSTTLLRFVCITQPVHTLIPSAKDTPVRTQIIAPEKERGHQPITASDHNPMHKLANFYKPLLLYQNHSSKYRKNTSAFTNIFCTLVCCIRESTYTYTNINGMTEGFYHSPLYIKNQQRLFVPPAGSGLCQFYSCFRFFLFD